jgi:hypothetical protein
MSLLKNFPEIHEFFVQSRFYDYQLAGLYELIDSRYTDSEINKAAKTLIKLELIKYQMQDAQVVKKQSSNKISNRGNSELKPNEVIRFLEIHEICNYIDWPVSRMKTILNRNKITKNMNDRFSNDELKIVMPYFLKAYDLKIRRNKLEKNLTAPIFRKTKEKNNTSSGVYGYLENFKGSMKLIYIRQKT